MFGFARSKLARRIGLPWRGWLPGWRKIFIHIGTHKTGTTSLQNFLHEQRDLLVSSGILYPEVDAGFIAHHQVAWELRRDSRCYPPEGHIENLFRQIRQSTVQHILISSEDFEYLSQYPKTIGDFVARLRRTEVEPIFVAFLRQGDSYLASLALELGKHGMSQPLGWFQEEVAIHNRILVKEDWYFEFDQARFAKQWSAATGCSLILIDYDRCLATEGTIPTFLRLIGATSDLIARSRNAHWLNASPRTAK
ncbi:MAG: hypothetical protein KGO53_03680 [Alphaproteobacteria bacterium]|nr:hypothetical protein [Alphaproteobacteria bacterium]